MLLPLTFLWIIQLKEYHPTHNQTDYSSCLYYWDYTRTPFATRQENNIHYTEWRLEEAGDIPWNVFWGFNGTLSAAYLSLQNAKVGGNILGTYDESYWPRELDTACELIATGCFLWSLLRMFYLCTHSACLSLDS
jgi:hypothetical protein